MRDITKRRQAEQERLRAEAALSESEERFRLLFEQAPLPYHSLDAEGTIIDVNPMWLETLGYRHNEVIGRSLIDFLPPERYEQFHESLAYLINKGKIDTELELIKKNGERLTAAITGKISRDKASGFLQTHCIFVDVTARQQTAKSLLQLSRAVEASPLSIIITDVDGSIEYVNPWFTQLTGYTQEEVQGQNPRILKSGHVPAETYNQLWHTILSGREWQGELTNRKKNGELFWDLISISPITNQAGDITHFVGIQTDITARKEAEERIANLAEFNENIIASAPVGIVTTNRKGQITSANSAFLSMVGSPNLEEILKLGINIPSIKQAGIDTAVNKVLTSGKTFTIDKLPYTSHWGKKLITNLKVVPQKTKDGRISGTIIVVDNVTAAARAEVLQTAVYRIAQAADRASSLDELFPAIHDIIKTVMPADNFHIALYDTERDMLHFPYYMDERKSTPKPPRRLHKKWSEFTLRHGVSQLVDAKRHQAMVEQGEVDRSNHDTAVWLGIPLIVDTRTIGVMVVQHYQNPHAYGEQEQHMLEYVASQVAQTIDRKQKEEALRQGEKKMRSLARLAQKLEQARTHVEIIEPLQEEIKTVLGYQTAWIHLFDKDRNYWWLLASAGTKASDLNNQAQILEFEGDAFLKEITETNHIVVVEDARTDPRTNKKTVAQLGNRTIINVPVFLENERLGSIATGSFGDEGVRIPSPFGLEYLKAIARHVAVVIDRIQFLTEGIMVGLVMIAGTCHSDSAS